MGFNANHLLVVSPDTCPRMPIYLMNILLLGDAIVRESKFKQEAKMKDSATLQILNDKAFSMEEGQTTPKSFMILGGKQGSTLPVFKEFHSDLTADRASTKEDESDCEFDKYLSFL